MQSTSAVASVDLDMLFRLRLLVARVGEMDLARWWNTRGQLGRLGAMALRRGFPRTHHFAQARSVFAVATARCREVFDPPASVTLWQLPAAIEEELDARWEHWIDHAVDWKPFFEALEGVTIPDLLTAARDLGLADDDASAAAAGLRRSAEGRAVQIPGVFTASPADLTALALGFARGEPGSLAVPYMRAADA